MQNNSFFLQERVSETLGLLCDHFPYRRLQRLGACGHRRCERLAGRLLRGTAGWERPSWLPQGGAGISLQLKRQNWFEFSAAEHLAVRERRFLRHEFFEFRRRPDEPPSCKRICANDVAVDGAGRLYPMAQQGGGIEADLTVTRLEETPF